MSHWHDFFIDFTFTPVNLHHSPPKATFQKLQSVSHCLYTMSKAQTSRALHSITVVIICVFSVVLIPPIIISFFLLIASLLIPILQQISLLHLPSAVITLPGLLLPVYHLLNSYCIITTIESHASAAILQRDVYSMRARYMLWQFCLPVRHTPSN